MKSVLLNFYPSFYGMNGVPKVQKKIVTQLFLQLH